MSTILGSQGVDAIHVLGFQNNGFGVEVGSLHLKNKLYKYQIQ